MTNTHLWIAIGNPPFSVPARRHNRPRGSRGGQQHGGLHFLHHCAELECNYVAFILGANMAKATVADRVHSNLHLVHQHNLGLRVFHADKRTCVRVVFQIWRRQPQRRPKLLRWTCTRWNAQPRHAAPFTLLRLDDDRANVMFRAWGWPTLTPHPHPVLVKATKRTGDAFHAAWTHAQTLTAQGAAQGSFFHLYIPKRLLPSVLWVLRHPTFLDAMLQETLWTPRVGGSSAIGMHAFCSAFCEAWARRLYVLGTPFFPRTNTMDGNRGQPAS